MRKLCGYSSLEVITLSFTLGMLCLVGLAVFWSARLRLNLAAARRDLADIHRAISAYHAQGSYPEDCWQSQPDVLPSSLTTPTAYLTRIPYPDALLEPGAGMRRSLRGYRYHNWQDDSPDSDQLLEADQQFYWGTYGPWVALSAGPDGHVDFLLSPGNPVRYDPSNGLASRGDLFQLQAK